MGRRTGADAGEAQLPQTLPAAHPRTVNPGCWTPRRVSAGRALRATNRVAALPRSHCVQGSLAARKMTSPIAVGDCRQAVDQHVDAELEPVVAVAGGHLL